MVIQVFTFFWKIGEYLSVVISRRWLFVFTLLFFCFSTGICYGEINQIGNENEIISIEKSFTERFSQLASEPFVSQRLEQYGYHLFEQTLADFEALRHLPIGPDYVLGPGDTMVIRIFGNVFAEYEVRIDRDGKVNVPEVGPIELWGLTFREARGVLEEHIRSYYAGIRVTVTMGELRNFFVHIIGEVNRPGIHELSSLSTVIQALFATRGPTRLGSLRDIRVLRDDEIICRFDLYDFLQEGRLQTDLRLQDNDVVFIPTLRGLVAIGGEVKRPAIYERGQEMHLSQLLDLAGGLTSTAFMRTVKIERIKENEEKILLVINATDLENFSGSKEDILLQDNDLVFIDTIAAYRMPERQSFVSILGNIPRPGDFFFSEEMTVKDLLKEAGGILPETLLERGEIWRFLSSAKRQVISFDVEKALLDDPEHNLVLKEWDQVSIYAVYDILPEEMVGIQGEVNKVMLLSLAQEEEERLEEKLTQDKRKVEDTKLQEGEKEEEKKEELPLFFPFFQGMTVRDLLFMGQEPTDNAYLERAELFRHRKGKIRDVIPINLREVLSFEFDLPLLPGDVLVVYHRDWVFPGQTVEIYGAVRKPGEYEFYREMTLGDLIFAAGGLEREAYLEAVEIYRPSYGMLQEPSLMTFNIRDFIQEPSGIEHERIDISLKEGDRVYIRTLTKDEEVWVISLQGEVNLPGEYVIRPGERLSSVLDRADGLTSMAYPFGAVLTREDVKEKQQLFIHDYVDYQFQQLAQKRALLLDLPLTTLEREERNRALDYEEKALNLMLARIPKGRILFDMEKALAEEGSFHNLELHHGDELLIPLRPQVVLVTGEVFNPQSIIYEPGRSMHFYLRQVGGVTPRGDTDLIYILKANGRVETQYTGYGSLNQGDIIVVPSQDPWKELDINVR